MLSKRCRCWQKIMGIPGRGYFQCTFYPVYFYVIIIYFIFCWILCSLMPLIQFCSEAAPLPNCCILYGIPLKRNSSLCVLFFSVPHRTLTASILLVCFAPYIHIYSRTSPRPYFVSFWHSKRWSQQIQLWCQDKSFRSHKQLALLTQKWQEPVRSQGRISLSHWSDVSSVIFDPKPQVVLWSWSAADFRASLQQ